MSQKNLTVLDFGSEKLTVLTGFLDVNNFISVTGNVSEYYEGFADGEFLEPKNLEKAITSVIKKAEQNCLIKIKKLTIGVPTEFCFAMCKNITQNFPKPKEIGEGDIKNLFKQANDFDKIKTHVLTNQDYVYFILGESNKVNNPVNMVESKITACLSYILVEKTFITTVSTILKKIGIKDFNFVCSAYAQSLYLFDDEQRDKYALVVDCGYITTSVWLSRGRGILNLSSFSLGGGHISADLSSCLKIPFASAKTLNKKIVLSVSPTDRDMYDLLIEGEVVPISMKVANAIVESRIEVIAQGIGKCFNLWNFNFPDFIPIYLTGGGLSFIRGAKNLLGKILGKNVEDAKMPYSQLNKSDYSSSMAVLNYALSNKKYEVKLENF